MLRYRKNLGYITLRELKLAAWGFRGNCFIFPSPEGTQEWRWNMVNVKSTEHAPILELFLQALSPRTRWLRLAACHPSFRVIRGADVFIVSAPAALAYGGSSFPLLEVRLNHSGSRSTHITASGFPLSKRHPLGQSGSSL